MNYTIQVIASFDDLDQEIWNITYNSDEMYVPGQITEARVMRDVLASLSDEELDQLCKLSLCVSGDKPQEFAPWAGCKNSPLNGGKLWLKQHRTATVSDYIAWKNE